MESTAVLPDVAAPAPVVEDRPVVRPVEALIYVLLGTVFGIILVKSEVISWYRIQEMFRFQSFHMYGVIMGAVVVAAASVIVLRRLGAHTLAGELIRVEQKTFFRGYNQLVGGTIFGLGWALTGACPGPLYALIGTGLPIILVPLGAAILGAWAYGALQHRLPH